jgi:hypothetical protein
MAIPSGRKPFGSRNSVGHAEVAVADAACAEPAPVAKASVAKAAPPRTARRDGAEWFPCMGWGLREEGGRTWRAQEIIGL